MHEETTIEYESTEWFHPKMPLYPTQQWSRAYLKKNVGEPPSDMCNPYAHHFEFKKGNVEVQKELVKEGQEILRRYDIDPIFELENLVWAPNKLKVNMVLKHLEMLLIDLETSVILHKGGETRIWIIYKFQKRFVLL